MARCTDPVPEVPLRELLGDGNLLFSLQNETMGMPYQSYVSLAGDSMAKIFEQFMTQSAQQPARLWLFADAERATGLFLQTLPPRTREGLDEVDPDGWNRIQQLAATLRAEELQLPAETVLTRLFSEEVLRVFEPCPVLYYCPRDEDKVRGMLASLGREEVADIIAEHGEIVIHDDICNHEYRFGAGIIEELFPSAGQTLH
jgi:molecular chaperone Hsp33